MTLGADVGKRRKRERWRSQTKQKEWKEKNDHTILQNIYMSVYMYLREIMYECGSV